MPTYPLQLTCLGVIIGSPLLASIFVGLRIYTRRKLNLRLSWDDWLIICPMVLSLALIGPSYRYVKMWHLGIHIWDVPWDQVEPNYDEDFAVVMAFTLINIPILPLVEASIIMLLLRAVSVIAWLKRTLYVILFFVTGSAVIPWFLYIFTCPPITGSNWKPRTFGGLHCMGRDKMGQIMLWVTCANLITDVLILPIPYFIVRKMMSTRARSRLVVVAVFNCSLAVAGIGAAMIYLSYRDQLYAQFTNDWTYPISYCIYHVENNVAIILANIPILRGLITRWVFDFKTKASPLEPEHVGQGQWYTPYRSESDRCARRNQFMQRIMPRAEARFSRRVPQHLSLTFTSGEYMIDRYETANACERGDMVETAEGSRSQGSAELMVQTQEVEMEVDPSAPSLVPGNRFSAATLLRITPVPPCRLKGKEMTRMTKYLDTR